MVLFEEDEGWCFGQRVVWCFVREGWCCLVVGLEERELIWMDTGFFCFFFGREGCSGGGGFTVVHRGNGISGPWFFDKDKDWRCFFCGYQRKFFKIKKNIILI